VALSDQRFACGGQALRQAAQGFRILPTRAVALPTWAGPHREQELGRGYRRFQGLVDKYPTHADAKGMRRFNWARATPSRYWPASAEVFARLLERSDCQPTIASRLLRGEDLPNPAWATSTRPRRPSVPSCPTARRSRLRSAWPRTSTWLFSQYHLAQISHRRFQAVELRLPEGQMDNGSRPEGHPAAPGSALVHRNHQIRQPSLGIRRRIPGRLALRSCTTPSCAPRSTELKGEAREVPRELHKKIRVLLEKSCVANARTCS